MALSKNQRETLALVCETLIPAANGKSLALQLEEVLSAKDPGELAQVGVALSLLESGAAGLLLTGRPGQFSRLSVSEREERLRRWATSPIPTLRQAFQGLKRLAAFLYWAAPEQPMRSTWGYRQAERTQGATSTLRAQAVSDASDGPYDAIVIGSGAGGGLIAGALAQRGMHVLILEKGGWVDQAELGGEELDGMNRLYLDRGMTATADLSIPIMAGGTVGGGTTVNWTTAITPPAWLREEWEHEYGLTGLTGAAFQRSVDEVVMRLGVNREWSRTAPEQVAGRLLAGAAALGWNGSELDRNVRECEGDCTYCSFGCRAGAKQSTRQTYLVDAFEHGAVLVAGADVRRVLIEAGAVVGVEVADGQGALKRFRAPRVIVAAGAIASPALLLRSGQTNPNIGRHLHLHPVTAVSGVYAEAPRPWTGRLLSAYSNQFQRLEGNWGFLLEHAPVHPGLGALAFPWHSGAQFTADMTRLDQAAPFIALLRDRGSGRVSLDRHGNHRVDYKVSAVDRVLLLRGQAELVRLHAAAGAEQVMTMHSRYSTWTQGEDLEGFLGRLAGQSMAPNRLLIFSAHQMGTCRLGASPATSVADPQGAVWGVKGLWIGDSSAFPSASGVNPMLTVMSLANWIAKGIA
ncbi:MAG TPA: GMC family oxidoreductase [Symbiobacteriaceae bacterium]|nr:GMC family oxidoreductase [Symbiobacteriaceae bacterium]